MLWCFWNHILIPSIHTFPDMQNKQGLSKRQHNISSSHQPDKLCYLFSAGYLVLVKVLLQKCYQKNQCGISAGRYGWAGNSFCLWTEPKNWPGRLFCTLRIDARKPSVRFYCCHRFGEWYYSGAKYFPRYSDIIECSLPGDWNNLFG